MLVQTIFATYTFTHLLMCILIVIAGLMTSKKFRESRDENKAFICYQGYADFPFNQVEEVTNKLTKMRQ